MESNLCLPLPGDTHLFRSRSNLSLIFCLTDCLSVFLSVSCLAVAPPQQLTCFPFFPTHSNPLFFFFFPFLASMLGDRSPTNVSTPCEPKSAAALPLIWHPVHDLSVRIPQGPQAPLVAEGKRLPRPSFPDLLGCSGPQGGPHWDCKRDGWG